MRSGTTSAPAYLAKLLNRHRRKSSQRLDAPDGLRRYRMSLPGTSGPGMVNALPIGHETLGPHAICKIALSDLPDNRSSQFESLTHG